MLPPLGLAGCHSMVIFRKRTCQFLGGDRCPCILLFISISDVQGLWVGQAGFPNRYFTFCDAQIGGAKVSYWENVSQEDILQ